ncbi:hypothetical protein EI94DRAFT_1177740 [Lactarius quietus]|nr:hypothetical protein EI94DRAFT_1177740 [Lactarius quietus]
MMVTHPNRRSLQTVRTCLVSCPRQRTSRWRVMMMAIPLPDGRGHQNQKAELEQEIDLVKRIECVCDEEKKGYVCDACMAAKIRCNPLNKNAEAAKLKHDTWEAVTAEKKAVDDAQRLVKKRAGKKPQDAPKAKSLRGRPRWSMVDTVEDNTAAVQDLHLYIVQAVEKLEKDIAELCEQVSVQRPGAQLPGRHLPPPPVFRDTPAATTCTASPSSIASSGSSMHITTLTLESPHTRMAGLPTAGPSGIRQERARPQAPGHILRSSSEQTRGMATVRPPSRSPSVPLAGKPSRSCQ